MRRLSPLLTRFRSAVSVLLILGGAAGVLAGVLGPWANVKIFHAMDLSLPGLFFAGGGLCLSVATLILFGLRRSPLLCVAGAALVLVWVQQARHDVPERVKYQLAGAQMALFPINRLLDQFHINNSEGWALSVSDVGRLSDDAIRGPGLSWAWEGGLALLLGSVLGLPGDPVVVWIYTRTARARCRVCGARWPASRDALYCPTCGTPVQTADECRCPACHTLANQADRHCIACGTALLP